jgi:hypothetical protein
VAQNCNDPQEDIVQLRLGDTTSCEARIRRADNVSYQLTLTLDLTLPLTLALALTLTLTLTLTR